jgi:hypothetical protein
MQETAYTAGMALGIGIYLAVMLGLVLAGGYLLRQRLNGVKVMLSCLAAIAGNFVAGLLSPLLVAGLSSVLAPGTRDIAALLLTSAITLAILAGCLTVIVEVRAPMGWALSLFANGGALASIGLLLMFSIGVLGDSTPGVVKTMAWVIIGTGLLLMLAGYQIGNSPAAQRGNAPAALSPNTMVPGVFPGTPAHNTIAPQPDFASPTFAANVGGRMTESRRDTVVHEDKIRPASSALLVVTVGREKGKRYDLAIGDTRVGRHSGVDIEIKGDEEVGREHCLIRSDGQQCVLYDLAARNGTFLNDTRVTDGRVLCDNDQVRVGQTVLVYKNI